MNQTDQEQPQGVRMNARRQFLKACPAGVGSLWLAGGAAAETPDGLGRYLTAEKQIHSPQAKHVIFLHMVGGPSQLELFDYKPELHRRDGQRCPTSLNSVPAVARRSSQAKLLGPQSKFAQHGQSGAWVSDRLPEFSQVVDSVAFIKSMWSDFSDHVSAQRLLHTGMPNIGSPSIGSWLTYGLGTENEKLPAHVVLTSGGKSPDAGPSLWGQGFLPSVYQGIRCRNRADPVLCLRDPEGGERLPRSAMVGTISAIKRRTYERIGNPDLVARIAQHEMAFQMQAMAAEALDVESETAEVHRLYGATPGETSFANNCLRARRLVQRGARCVQLFDNGWDSHGVAASEALNGGFGRKCRQIDRPIAGLLQDLQRSGLLEETLVVWSGEFGRGPTRGNGNDRDPLVGRDHQPQAFTAWLAGGGIQGGVTIGATDSLGASVVDQPIHVRDLHGTIFGLLGLDHRQTASADGKPASPLAT